MHKILGFVISIFIVGLIWFTIISYIVMLLWNNLVHGTFPSMPELGYFHTMGLVFMVFLLQSSRVSTSSK